MNHRRFTPRPEYHHQFTFTEDECKEIIEELRVYGVHEDRATTLSRFYKALGQRNLS